MDAVRSLFREYEAWLEIDLCFQGFEEELAGLPGYYSPPRGFILLAVAEEPVGCIALRPISEEVCEMKRLFVTSPYRGTGLGRRLAEACVAGAVSRAYHSMKLDTLKRLTPAISLYRSLGFHECEAYYANPHEVLYMEKALAER